MHLSDLLPGRCQYRNRKCNNSIPITWPYRKCFLGGEPLSCSHVSSVTRRWVKPCSPAAMFQAWPGSESNPVLPQPCFQHARRMYLSDILPGRCYYRKRKCNNSIPITWPYRKCFLGGEPLSCSHVSSTTRRWVEPYSPAAMFPAWQADVLIQYTTRELLVLKKEVW